MAENNLFFAGRCGTFGGLDGPERSGGEACRRSVSGGETSFGAKFQSAGRKTLYSSFGSRPVPVSGRSQSA